MHQEVLSRLSQCVNEGFPHLDGVQELAEVEAEGRLAGVEGVCEVQGHGHVPGAHRLLVHGLILTGGPQGNSGGSFRFRSSKSAHDA